MTRSKSSKNWLREHFDDRYVKQSKQAGYRSRSSFKLLEIQKKDKLLHPGMVVIDLGAAPGGWSQVAADLVGDHGRVVASDILPMPTIAGVEFVQGDFTEGQVLEKIVKAVGERPVDLVISDMAPNMSGIAHIDQPKALYLVELAFDLARQVLRPGGSVLTKVFQGQGTDTLMADLRNDFSKLMIRKPDASRSRSREVYWVIKGFKG